MKTKKIVLSMWPRDPILGVKLVLDVVGVTLCEWRVEEVCYHKTQGPNSKCKIEALCSERPSLRVDSKSVLSQWPRGLILSPRMEVISSTSPHHHVTLNFSPIHISFEMKRKFNTFIYVSLRLRVQNAVPAQPCVGKYWISLILLNFLHCNFRLWFKTP